MQWGMHQLQGMPATHIVQAGWRAAQGSAGGAAWWAHYCPTGAQEVVHGAAAAHPYPCTSAVCAMDLGALLEHASHSQIAQLRQRQQPHLRLRRGSRLKQRCQCAQPVQQPVGWQMGDTELKPGLCIGLFTSQPDHAAVASGLCSLYACWAPGPALLAQHARHEAPGAQPSCPQPRHVLRTPPHLSACPATHCPESRGRRPGCGAPCPGRRLARWPAWRRPSAAPSRQPAACGPGGPGKGDEAGRMVGRMAWSVIQKPDFMRTWHAGALGRFGSCASRLSARAVATTGQDWHGWSGRTGGL